MLVGVIDASLIRGHQAFVGFEDGPEGEPEPRA